MLWGMSVNFMCLLRNAFTATSLAAFRVTGAVPCSANACLAKVNVGNFFSSGWLNVSLPICSKFRFGWCVVVRCG